MKLTKTFTTCLVLATLSFSTLIKAGEVTLPVVSKPAVLKEGTQTTLADSQIAELLPWAKDSKIFLEDLLNSLQGLSSQDKVDQLVQGITQVVGESSPKNSELFMRYVLNRGLVINETLGREMGGDEVGTVDAKIRVLVFSVKMAIKYYDSDLNVLSKKSSAPYARFGEDYFSFLIELNKSIFDASAQYSMFRTSIEWLQWDLYRDLNNTAFAPQIVKINNALKLYPNKKMSDSQALAFIRQMKTLTQQLDLKATLSKVDADARILFAKSEAERQRLIKEAEEAEYIRTRGPIVATVQTIATPRINGVYFAIDSDRNGVCINMGFEKAVPGDIRKDGTPRTAAIVVNSKGELTGAKKITDSEGYVIAEITCANKILAYKPDTYSYVSSFTFGEDLIISSKSNENGVCKALGYEKGAIGSGTTDGTYRGSMLVIDKNGKPSSSDVSTESAGHRFSSVICVNQISEPTFAVKSINNPRYNGQVFSSKSKAAGMCKVLGYNDGLEGVYKTNGSLYGTSIIVDVTGSAIGTETINSSSGYGVDQVYCLK